MQTEHHWYKWGTYTCGNEITESDISTGTMNNAWPTGVVGSLFQAPLQPNGLSSTDVASVGVIECLLM